MPRSARDRLPAWSRPRPVAPTDIETWDAPATGESDIPACDDFADLLWARGFLLTAERHRVPVAHWRQIDLGGRCLSYDPRTPIAVARAGTAWVALLGRAIDLDGWSASGAAIAAKLLRAKLTGRGEMSRTLDMLSGRFAVFDGDEHSSFIQTDAAGMRAVFHEYDKRSPCAASHSGLVAEHVGAGPSAFPDPTGLRRETGAYALPGTATTFEGVVMLMPNTELDCVEGRVRRVFPRGRAEHRSAGEVVDEVLPLLQGQLEVLTERERLEVSLTAGLDSRTTLALTRPFTDRLSYFTYDTVNGRGPARRRVAYDVAIAAELTGRFGLDHHRIEVEGREADEPLRGIMQRNSPRRSHPALSSTHREHSSERGLHLRSNLYEIGRAFYRSRRERPKTLGPGDMVSLLTGDKSESAAMKAEFERYVRDTGFKRAQRLCDPLDLFYWEHRSGMWLNAHLTESDIAFDTFILVNSRHMYRLLLSAPLADRIAGTVFVELIRRSWPEVLDVPVNGETIG
ncbi:hypothetical protein L0U85_12560 [Glycomyces sp. L485]|uniref:hypothetical protein n=1 Tax=Glycomyces sp. L485 TaxID=2909235 RepID=UPI001F4B636D|nr:hypothetical protein [Glycomyces sp. L485]MCH7231676.1 hypothetical protein [Glycomyces sp. L485]